LYDFLPLPQDGFLIIRNPGTQEFRKNYKIFFELVPAFLAS